MDIKKMNSLTQGMKNIRNETTNNVSYGDSEEYFYKGYNMFSSNPVEAFSWFKKAAEMGHTDAMFYVGRMYQKGIGVIENQDVAIKWLQKSADGGNTDAMIAYGNCLEEKADKVDDSLTENPNSFISKLGNAAKIGATFMAQNKIIECYTKAIEGGNIEGYFHLGFFYFKKANSRSTIDGNQDRLDAIKYLNQGIRNGHALCMWALGAVWENIYDTLDNESEHYYRNELRNVPGDNSTERAANLAAHWYEQAANAGVEEAQQALEDFKNKFFNGRGGNSGGNCFITTAVCDSFGKADDCYELTAFRNFRDNWLALQNDGKNLIAEYYNIAPKIVEKINGLNNAAQIYKNIWEKYLAACLNFIEKGDNLSCKNTYIDMVKNLKKKFLGE